MVVMLMSLFVAKYPMYSVQPVGTILACRPVLLLSNLISETDRRGKGMTHDSMRSIVDSGFQSILITERAVLEESLAKTALLLLLRVNTHALLDIGTEELDTGPDLALWAREHLRKFVIMRGEKRSAFRLLEQVVKGRIGDRHASMQSGTSTDPI